MGRQVCVGQMRECFTTGLHVPIFIHVVLMPRGWYCNPIERGTMRHLFFLVHRGSVFVPSVMVVFLCLLLAGCNVSISTGGGGKTPTASTTGTPHWGVQTRTSGCM